MGVLHAVLNEREAVRMGVLHAVLKFVLAI